MARNDSDSEFDHEMERVLRDHFDSEAADLQAPNDPWPWLESRLEEPAPPSFFSRLLGRLSPVNEGRLSPGFAVASLAAIAIATAVVVWAVAGNDGREPPAGLVAIPATEAPGVASTSAPAPTPTAAPIAMARGENGSAEPQGPAGPAGAAGAAGPQGASGPAGPTGESRAAPTVAAATTAAAAQVEVTRIAEAESASESGIAMASAAPTPAPQATSLPQAAAAPSGSAGAAGHPQPQASADGFGSGTPPGTTFRNYQRQPFVSSSEDNVSTFSLDTDRTSYPLALNWARAGFEINPDSVRAEEWLNAFDYEYEPPSVDDKFAITSDLLPHPLDDDKHLARIAFQAPELVDDKPLNVTLVLDASGSMADGNRVAIARMAAESIRRSLGDDDRIAVVHFTEDVIDRYTVQHRAPDDNRVADSINWLQPHGSTNVQAGLNLGVRLADQVRDQRPDAYNYVILMSDGVANVDATDPFAILETAYDPNSRNPLRLITIGVGINNYNDPLLELLAQHGNGWYRYLSSVEQAEATFTRENWLALSIPFADQTRAQVTWNTGTVEEWRIIGYENRVTADENFTQDRREFAEIYSGAATTVLYEVVLTDAASDLANVPLGRVEIRWVDPDSGDSRTQTSMLGGDSGAGPGEYERDLARFGAIVALSADLYGALPNYPECTYPEVHSGLAELASELRGLRDELGSLDSFNDFEFLLGHITDDVEGRLPPSNRSGYSR